jgi:DNA repair exonuclease SbcCD nuclease subunit
LKVAVTSDLHLTAREKHPGRFEALESILRQMAKESLDTLIIAGDLFDEHSRNYAEFDALCRDHAIHFFVLPGNHDAGLRQKSFSAQNVHVLDTPTIHRFDLMSLPILFIPYAAGQTMGEAIQPFSAELEADRWILVGHGDRVEGTREPNPLEPGVYMPLGRSDIVKFRPARALLGHIHKPADSDPAHYCGSPFPHDINETGRRRFLVLDTETGEVESRLIHSGPIYLQETFVVLPVADEARLIQTEIEKRIASWNLSPDEKKRVRLRISVKGYSADKRRLLEAVQSAFHGFSFYEDKEPDLSDVFLADDSDRAEIARQIESAIDRLGFRPGPDEPDRETILLHALHTVYGAP